MPAQETLLSVLARRASASPQRVAYRFLRNGEEEAERLTYGELAAAARRIAAGLGTTAAPGDRIVLALPPGLDFIAAFLGCLAARLIAVPVRPPRPDRLESPFASVVRDCAPAAVLTSARLARQLAAATSGLDEFAHLAWLAVDDLPDADAAWRPTPPTARQVAFLQYTSGSTSAPKGVMVTHANLMANEEIIRRVCRHDEASTFVSWLPMYHDMGLIGAVLQPLYCGSEGVLMSPTAFLQQPMRWLRAIERYRAHTSGGPNFAFDLCVARSSAAERATLDLSSWQVAFNGAEPVRPATLERFAIAFAPAGFHRSALLPCYGLAESTLMVTSTAKAASPRTAAFRTAELGQNRAVPAFPGADEVRYLASAGRAVPGTEVAIVRPGTTRRCEPGEVGEVWVRGRSVAAGYWQRPELSAEVFGARLDDAGRRPFLRTGDLGFLADGELFVAGRSKDLIILRGRNHYPQDLELTVQGVDLALRAGCGAAFAVDVGEEERLVVVQEVKAKAEVAAGELLRRIVETLGQEHEVAPHAVVLIEEGSIPKTTSGKIQRFLCRQLWATGKLRTLAAWPDDAQPTPEPSPVVTEASPPTNAAASLFSRLRATLAAKLRRPAAQLAADRPLASFGLDSLAAIELAHALERDAGVVLDGAELLAASLADLERIVGEAGQPSAAQPSLAEAPPPTLPGAGPLSAGQLGIWLSQHAEPRSPAYNIPLALVIEGTVDPTSLEAALVALVSRHEELRAHVETTTTGPRQVIAEAAAVTARRLLQPVASRTWSEAQVREFASERSLAPFDLGRAPLFRAWLLPRSAERTVLLLVVHHLVVDLWSLALLVDELAAAAQAAQEGRPYDPPAAPSYGAYVRWQAARLAGPTGERVWSYWRQQLAGELPALRLPADHPRQGPPAGWGLAQLTRLDGALTDRLRALAAGSETTLFVVLLSAFQAFLYRLTGERDLLVGAPAAGRGRAEWAGLVGYLVNPLALRARIAPGCTFAELLASDRATVAAALANQEMPFATLVERLRPEREAGRNPLVQALFSLQSAPGSAGGHLGALAVEDPAETLRRGAWTLGVLPLCRRPLAFDLELMAAESSTGLSFSWRYDPSLFDATTIRRWSALWSGLLATLASAPATPLSALPVLSPSERQQLLVEWNGPGAAPAPDAMLDELVWAEAERSPDAVAVVAEESWLSYRALTAGAAGLAARLGAAGVGAETRVGLLLPRGLPLLSAVLAVLRSGAAYVPLDPAYPTARLQVMLRDSAAPIVIADRELAAGVDPVGAQWLWWQEGWEHRQALDPAPSEAPAPRQRQRTAQQLAYVLYTSGSTGTPKGVAIPHRAATSFIGWALDTFRRELLGRVLFSTSICFDLSVFEIFAPLACGGTVILAENALALPQLPAASLVRLINTVPSVLAELLTLGDVPSGVRAVGLAGEPLRANLVGRLAERAPRAAVLNLYGPTEATTYATWTPVRTAAEEPSLGRPLATLRGFVIDPAGRPTAPGVVGELLLGGLGLARGYLGRPALTAAAFVPDGLAGGHGERLYRTGDLVRWRADGNLELLGRRDHQVKVRGFRIELGDVERAMLAATGAAEAIALVLGDGPERALIGYLTAPAATDEAELRRRIGELVPAHMVPARLVVLPSLPRTPNGKIDRKALPRPQAVASRGAPPQGPWEELVAEVWGEVLGAATVSRDASFFSLGGHSLAASRVMARLRERSGVSLPLRRFFEAPTVEGLAAILATQAPQPLAPRSTVLPFVPRPGREDVAPPAETALSVVDLGALTAADRPLVGRALAAGALAPAFADDAVARPRGLLLRHAASHGIVVLSAPLRASGPQAVALLADELAELGETALGATTAPAADGPARLRRWRRAADGRRLWPLSFAQERLWFLDQMEGPNAVYNLPAQLELTGGLDVAALSAALARIVERHDMLRAVVVDRLGEPWQRVEPYRPTRLPVIDLSGLAAGDRAPLRLALAAREAARPFDLGRGPLLRTALLRLSTVDHLLLWTLHHIAGDGWSMGVFAAELARFYGAAASGEQVAATPLPLQFPAFAARQRRELAAARLETDLAYWRRELAGALPLDLPTDRPRRARPSRRGGTVPLRLDAATVERLREVGRRHGATLFMVAASAYAVLLARRAEQHDITLGWPIAGRPRPELEGLIGCFVNTLVIRLRLAEAQSFASLLHTTRETSLAAFDHQETPFEQVVTAVDPGRDTSRSPLFQAMLSLEEEPAVPRLAGLAVRHLGIPSGVARFDLTWFGRVTSAGLEGELEYDADLFDRTTARRMALGLGRVLEAVAEGPQRAWRALPWLTPAEEHQVSCAFNDAGTAASGVMAPARFEAVLRRQPEHPALVWGEEVWTYAELDRRARTIAGELAEQGVGPEERVGICLERTPDLVAALLATWLAGGAYLPLDPAYPRERLRGMLADSGARLLLTRGELAADLAAPGGRRLDLAHPPGAGTRPAAARELAPASLAYVLYTSGSTGRPKGVAIPHGSVAALLDWTREHFAERDLDGVVAATSVSFDLSVFELFMPLCRGGRVILVADALAIADLPAASAPRLVNTVPSAMAELVRQRGLPASVEVVCLAGEALPASLADAVYRETAARRLYNLYGPTEDTTYSTWSLVPRGGGEPAIGRPLSGTRAWVLDRAGAPSPLGVPGLLLLAGHGLARGYLRRPGLTAERFVPDPRGQAPGERSYVTGDLARWRPSGELEYLGRIDHQVKLRGFRIELGEVEAALLDQPGVREAVAGARDGRLIAWLGSAAAAELDPEQMRSALSAKLPAYMVPGSLVLLAELPRLPNGKVDRGRLPDPQAERPRGGPAALPLASSLGRRVAAIWHEVLGVETVGPDDDFFTLGGHSLLATRVVSRLRQELGIELSVRLLFEAGTLGAFVNRLETLLAPEPAAGAIPPLPPGQPAPLSFAQERMWFLDQLHPGDPTYNLSSALRLRGELDPRSIAQALTAIVRRHAVLRTGFLAVAGRPRLQPLAAARVALPVVDLSRLTAPSPAEASLVAGESLRPFDLGRPPFLRGCLLHWRPDHHVLLLSAHHIAFDGWSMAILLRELATVYEAASTERRPELPRLAIQYADYAAWQREHLTGEALERDLAFWRQQLGDEPPPLLLPVDRPRTASVTARGGGLSLHLPAAQLAAVRALGQRHGATLFMTLLAAFQALLHRLGGTSDLAVGSPTAGRNHPQVEALLGFFVNTIVLRSVAPPGISFADFLAAARARALAALEHQDVPFEHLVALLQPRRDLAGSPFFQVQFALQNMPLPQLTIGRLELTPVATEAQTSKADLTLFAAEIAGGLDLRFVYRRDLFDRTTITRWAKSFVGLLQAVGRDPATPLAALPPLSAAESHQLSREWRDGGPASEPPHCVHSLFEAQVDTRPDAVALIDDDGSYTFAAAEERANHLAGRLRARGAGPEAVVVLDLERGAAVPLAMLGVLKAGAAYLPLDRNQPGERRAALVRASGAVAAVGADGADRGLATVPGGWLELETAGGPPAARPAATTRPENLAYVLFTSGSTGEPKGVAIEHRQLWSYVEAVVSRLPLAAAGAGLHFATVSTFAADLGNTAVFPALCRGGCLHVIATHRLTDPLALGAYFAERPIDVLKIVPSHLAALEDTPRPAAVLPRRLLVLGGESLEPAFARRQLDLRPGLAVLNHYGPTETTVGVLTHRVPATAARAVLPLGRALAGVRPVVVDRALRLQPLGVPGELLIGGSSVARGYLGQPARTAERFLPDAWSATPGARLYKSGDLVRCLADGEVEFLGRVDHQIKVRGFRVELGEIEAALQALPGVAAAAVVASGDAAADRRLIAYVGKAAGAPEDSALRQQLLAGLAARLPAYMVPAELVVLAALPRNANGKVDRRALPAPAAPVVVLDAAPQTWREVLLARQWAELLGLAAVGREQSFFELGGHSLLATQALSRLRSALRVEVPLRALFDHPTVAGLARWLAEQGAESPEAPLVALPAEAPAPLSFGQERLWFLYRLDPASTAYHLPYHAWVEGPLVVRALRAGLVAAQERHTALRSRIVAPAAGAPQQVLRPALSKLPVVDLGGLAPAQRQEVARGLAAAEARRPFDLAADPPLRACLARLAAQHHALLLTLHHLACDGWSRAILSHDLGRLYAAAAHGRPASLAPLALQYRDYAAWERERLAGPALAGLLAEWVERLRELPPVELPTDRPRLAHPAQRAAAGSQRSRLAASRAARLEAAARHHGATPFMLALAALGALVGRLAGQRDLAIGAPVAHRTRAELEGVVGFFVNTLVLRLRLGTASDTASLIAEARSASLWAQERQDVPFERLVAALVDRRDLNRRPLVQVALAVQNTPEQELAWGEVTLVPLGTPVAEPKFDLLLSLTATGDELAVGLEYDAALFDPTTARRWLATWERLLDALAAEPSRPLAELPWLATSEVQQLLREWSEPAAVRAGDTLSERFAAQAGRTSERIALIDQEERLSFAELAARAGGLAAALVDSGVGPEMRVAVALPRRAELVVALLAVGRAGGAYVPLDLDYPAERLAFLLADSAASLLIAEPGPALSATLALLPQPPPLLGPAAAAALPAAWPAVTGQNLAYLIYTSGSTGKPKAVAIEHANATARLDWAAEAYPASERAGVLAATAITFDLSIFELFVPLTQGGTVILAANAPALADLPARGEVSLLNTVPSLLAELLARDAVPPQVRVVNVAGEPLSAALARQLLALPAPPRLCNLYGPSEDTTYSTAAIIEPGDDGEPAIGRPLPGGRARIVDHDGRLVPAGVPGELLLGGPGVARGYLGRPGLTAARFVPDPWSERPGERLYRTGDRVRSRPDGALEFLGRLDFQVKLRGFRIELGEIESALAALPGVAEAAVLARPDGPQGPWLVAYVAGAAEAALPGLRQALGERLPRHLVPAAFVGLARLPRTPHGKVDRRALPAPTVAGRASGATTTPSQEVLAGLWAQLLGVAVESIGAEADFFALGGQSLLATNLVAQVQAAFGVDLPLRAVFEHPDLAALAEAIDRLLAGEVPRRPELVRVAAAEPVLSFAQERLAFLERLDPTAASYNLPLRFRLRGPLDLRRLDRALSALTARHDALRLGVDHDGAAVLAAATRRPRSTVVDLGGVAAPAALATELARREAHRPFALDRPPLLRAVTLRLGPGAHQLLLSLHHLAADGPSLEVLHQDLARLYEDPGGLPALPFRYLDFAAWQRRCLGAAAIAALCDWWRRELAQAPQLLSLPTDRPRPPFAGATAGQVSFELPAASLAKLDALARQGGATRFMTLLAGLQALLARWSGQADLLVGTPVAGRGHGGLQGLIGLFAGTLVLRGSLVAGDSFHTWLGRVRRRTLAAFAHQDLPFEKLVEVLAPERSLDHAPLFQVLLVLHAALPRGLALPGVAVEVLPSLHRAAKVDLTVAASGGEAGLEGLLEYRADLFDATTMQRFADQLRAWFEAAVAAPERPIETFDLLSPAARQQLMREWNDRGDAAAATTLPALVWAQVARAPQAVAVRCHDEQLSYAELGRRITALAARLAFYGVGAEAKVGLGLTRAAELVVAPLAVHWLGAAYVPIDAELPAERRAFLLADCGARVLVSSPGLAEHWGAFAGEVLRLAGTPAAAALQAPAPAAPDGLAYVLYTSGSTGRPKGVGITQRSLCHLLATIADRPGLAAGERLFAVTALSFDIAGVELFLPLVSGGTVVLATREEAQDGRRLARRVDEAQPDLLQATPATWQLLLDAGWQGGALRAICGGEALLPSLAAALAPRVAALWNLYGPTETTIWSTGLRVAPGREITIGRPLAATTAVVLDRRLQPAALGVPGELWLGGAGLARGYLGRPGLTAERFVPAPGDALPGERFYRTGDLVRSRPGGEIEFLGRIDFQVKVRGYRIELGEIEAALAALPEVAEAAVVPWQPQAGELRLAAYVAGPAEAEVGALRAALAERLPAIMLPAAWTVLPALPRTPNGKLDRRALPPPSLAALAPEGGAPPQGFVEEQLADLWREVLGGESISRDDDFFALGGHSLAAGRLLARLRAALGVELPLRVVFEAPRLAEQARQVADLLAATSLPLAPYPPEVPRRLSFGQERLWVLDRLGAGAVLNVPVGLRITGELDRAALGAALAALLRRQQALRTGVDERDGVALPRLLAARRPTLPLIDLGGLAAEAAEAAASEIAGREANRAFDLRREVPLRCRLLRLGPGQHALLVCLHHIAGDGVSLQIFFDELLAHYQASRARKPAPLAELRVQYGDFALWQRDWLAGELLEEELDYWLRQLAELPGPLPLPFDRPRTAARSWAGASLPLRLDAAACRPLRQLASRQQVTLFTLLLAAFKVLLHGLSGQPDLVVGAPVANRSRLETERLIGFFVNTLVLRSRLSGLGTFADLLASERETVLGALAHQEVPFNLLAQRLGAQPTATANPLFQVGLTFGAAAMAPTASHELAGLSCQPFPIAAERSQFELNLNLSDLGGEIRGSWQYATDLFDRATVEAIAEAFAQVLAAVAGSEDVALTSLAALVAERFARRRQEAAEQLASAASSKLRLARRKPHRVEGDERAPAGSAH